MKGIGIRMNETGRILSKLIDPGPYDDYKTSCVVDEFLFSLIFLKQLLSTK